MNIAVFYPEGGVSKIQELQMKTQEGENTYVYAVKGNFDDAQNMVKEVFNDEKIKNELYKNGVVLSSANSINIGRLIPQIVYYVTSYVKLVNEKTISLGDRINFTVPTGNFGNILAGYIAKKIGLPINKLICAANENNVLTDFINTGEYNIERKFIKTISPSMDILISSNLERLLYFLSNEDDAYINKLMKDLKNDKKYKVSKNIQNDIKKLFWSDFSTEEETLASIKNLYKNLGYVIDTHTAVAVDVYNKYKNETNDKTINVILSTASPFKFIESVYFAVESKKIDNNANIIEEFSKRFELEIPKEILNLENKKHKHNEILEIKNVEEKIIKISFILDTKFNERIIPFVKDSDLLVSEATYSQDLKKEADEHLHLTVLDAAEIAKKANAKKLLLVHVSSRYLKDMKCFLNEAKEVFKESYLPRDLDFFVLE